MNKINLITIIPFNLDNATIIINDDKRGKLISHRKIIEFLNIELKNLKNLKKIKDFLDSYVSFLIEVETGDIFELETDNSNAVIKESLIKPNFEEIKKQQNKEDTNKKIEKTLYKIGQWEFK